MVTNTKDREFIEAEIKAYKKTLNIIEIHTEHRDDEIRYLVEALADQIKIFESLLKN